MGRSHGSVAKSVREAKEQRPEFFCRERGFLWRIVTPVGNRPCPKHPVCVVCGSAINRKCLTMAGRARLARLQSNAIERTES